MAKSPYISIKHLYKIFGDKPEAVLPLVEQGKSKTDILAETQHTVGLKDINLEIKRGEIFVIMGLSGSGKSTLIRHFNRLIEPTSGEILLEGDNVMELSPKDLQEFRRKKMSMVFQHFGLLPHESVINNAAYGLAVQGVDKKTRLKKAKQWLKTVGLEGYEDQYPSQISGGQQQRVGLARALATDSDILLMDEAFSALDPLIRSEMQDQLIELQDSLHKTIIFITHDLDEALRLGDRIAILRDGELIQVGEPVDILLRPADSYVESFVKDVNRARALTVENVMKPPSCRITDSTIGEALDQMRKHPRDYAYYFDGDDYQGVVLQETLEEAAPDQNNQDIESEMLEDIPSIPNDALLETVIPETLDTNYPLPVIDKEGNLCGQLSRTSLASALTDLHPHNDDDGSDEAA